MSLLDDGFGGLLVLGLIALIAHEPWRWLGVVLGRNIDPAGEIFQWVRAVATALVAGLVLRLLLFPAGALAEVPAALRLAAFAGAIACFFLLGRTLMAGIGGGVGVLVVLKLLVN